MSYLLDVLYLLLILAQIICMCFIRKRHGILGRRVRLILLSGAGIVLSYGLGAIVNDEFLSMFMYGIFIALTNWFIFALLSFCELYTGVFYEVKPVSIALIVYNSIATLLLIGNLFYCKLFGSAPVSLYETLNHPAITFFKLERYPLLIINSVICAVIVFGAVTSLFVKMLSAPRIYMQKYVAVLFSMIFLLVFEGMRFITDVFIGFSPLSYGIISIFIFYYALYYGKKHLLGDLLAKSIKTSPSALLVFDTDGACVYSNDLADEIFDLKGNDSENLRTWIKGWQKNRSFQIIDDMFWTEVHENNGEKHHLESSYNKLIDKDGNYLGFSLSLTDRTREISRLKSEQYKALHDPLTALYNKEGFERRVLELINREPDVPRTIVTCDIKNFKLINELFGQKQSDGLLINIGQLMSSQCASTDSIPARLEADRFAICMRTSRYSDSLFEEVVKKSVQIPGNEFYKVVCYVGVYDITDPSVPVSVMCDKAQAAINTIKGDYNRIVAHYDGNVSENSKREQELIKELNHAIEARQFQIFIQPQVDNTGKTVGGEALARWIHPKKGLVSPQVFIPVFERTGLITLLDKYVWELAAETLARWQAAGNTEMCLSVNISPRDFFYVDIYKTFTEIVEKYQIPVKSLKLEITEGAIMSDADKQIELITRLKEYGFVIEMDDFGSGYSSLNTLKNVPVDAIKLDVGILKKSNDSKIKGIIKSIIELAKMMNIATISEGVENEAQVNMLKKLGCDYFQGFFYAEPMPVGDFETKYIDVPTNEEEAAAASEEKSAESEGTESTEEGAEQEASEEKQVEEGETVETKEENGEAEDGEKEDSEEGENKAAEESPVEETPEEEAPAEEAPAEEAPTEEAPTEEASAEEAPAEEKPAEETSAEEASAEEAEPEAKEKKE